MATAQPSGHTPDQAVGIARRLLTVHDEDARLAAAIQFCEHASSCHSGSWLQLLTRGPPARSRSAECLPPMTLLDEVLLFVIVFQLAAPGVTACDVLRCPANCEYSVWRASASPSSDRMQRLLASCTWTADAVSSAARAVQLVKEPRVRQKALQFFTESIQRTAIELAYSKSDDDRRFFDGVIELIIIGTTDLWSAIRKDTAKNAAKMAACFPTPELLDSYIDKLLPIMAGVKSSGTWTEQEGALLAMNELLKAITRERRDSPESDKLVQSRVVNDIQGSLADQERATALFRVGQRGLPLSLLPKGVASSLKPALYRCLQHDQLTVRQTAAECLLAYASLCEESVRLAVFQETISKLNRIPDGTMDPRADASRDPLLLGAFEAEGLLDVLAKITTALPPTFLVRHWKFIIPTLERYVIHVASSVRQRSSAVILSLAKLSLNCSSEQGRRPTDPASAEAAVRLLTQMLLSLSQQFETESALCWQKREGRLLSVDVLVNVIGQDIVLHECGGDRDRSASRREGALSASGRDEERHWTHDQLASATWTADLVDDPSWRCGLGCTSIARRVDLWITQSASKHDLPRTSALFWQQVLRGWLAQVEAGFSSAQFELQRISKQVLPGLMRLCIWLEQLEIVQHAVFEKNPATSSAWRWLSGKYLLLHLRYLHECNHTLGNDAAAVKMTKDEDTVWDAGVEMLRSDADGTGDVEATVAKVEMLSMMFAHYTPARKPPDTLLEILDTLLRHVHAALPHAFQVASIATGHVGSARDSNTFDRQFCTSLIRMLPAMTASLIGHLSNTERLQRPRDLRLQKSWLSHYERWLAFERMTLAWLSSDDMMRWISVPKATGRPKLLQSLLLLVQKLPEAMAGDEMRAEFDLVVRHTSTVIAADQRGVAYHAVIAEILLSMWSQWSEKVNLPIDEFVASLAGICASAQPDNSSKTTSASVNCSASDSWDDWDDEETRAASVITEADACSTEVRDGGLKDALSRLKSVTATCLLTAVQATQAQIDARKPRHQQLELLAQLIQDGQAQR